MQKYSILLILWAGLLLTATSCGPFRSSVKKGDSDVAQGKYQPAIAHYQAALKKGKNLGPIHFKLAEAYRLSNRLPQTPDHYKAALDLGAKNEETLFRYGMALKAAGNYDAARQQLESYLAVASNRTFIAAAQREVANLKALPEILKTPSYQVVKPVVAVNTAASEFSPVVQDGHLWVTATLETTPYLGNGEGFQNLYLVAVTDTAAGTLKLVPGPVNADGRHDASPAFTNQGRTIVFARSNTGKKSGRNNVDLFISNLKTGAWSEPTLPTSINDDAAWDATPAFSPDGRTLYFSSNRRGGQGGNDLWSTTLDAGGRFSRPVNLGPTINTPGNESYPFVAEDGTLYFASDGHAGLGGLDLFQVIGDSVVNLGSPINTSSDDFAIFLTGENQGFIASNRPGGQGGDDIYSFRKEQPKLVNFFVDGRVLERNAKTQGTTTMANIRVTLQNAAGDKINETVSGPDGTFSFPLDTAQVYSVLAEQNGYFAARQPVQTLGKTPPQNQLTKPLTEIRLSTSLVLSKIVRNKAIVVDNIFYDYDKSDIRPDAALELDKLVQTLVDNPRITIELSSHTDARGKDSYNQDLSQRRAQSAVDYIISKGIASSRIAARGYGETQPVVRNAKTEEEHQRNRRTEFKVTRIED